MDIKKILPDNGPPINEVSKYIEKYKNELIVIKYGGNVFIDRDIFNNFITDINILNKLGISIVIVHGGGFTCPFCDHNSCEVIELIVILIDQFYFRIPLR